MGREHSPHPASRRRVFSELLPYAEVAEPRVLTALAARDIELLVAVTPEHEVTILSLVDACRAHGVRMGLWPMLADSDGRWASERNARVFTAFADRLLDRLDERALPDVFVLDLEPPIREVRALIGRDPRVALRWLLRRTDVEATRLLRGTVERARARGLEVYATVVPPLGTAFGAPFASALATPLAELALDRVAPMLYTSLLEGYSRGALRRADARSLLYELARATAAHEGPRAAVCLGAISTGALGDERPYRGVRELADDIALASAAGIGDIALFDLAGALAHPPFEAWLDALVATPPAPAAPRPTFRARTLLATLAITGRALARAQRPFRAL